ncbi:MAG TPA: hypothetical protein VNJ50_05065 [Gelidibacter sp.]|uniref:hypothetical protein n=1 Tax=Gelidibacter sp. TaxID=2018083 RepID=UPI002CBE189E|nr:hypothetical protein [Gelidibacter sp.]HXJ98194.1 hypothetical protein [Gelidibacter sp.]
MEFLKFKSLGLFSLFFLLVIVQVEAQDIPIRSIAIPAVKKKDEDKKPEPQPVKIEPVKKEEVPTAEEPITIRKNKTEFSMFDNSDLRDPGEIFNEKWNKKAVQQGFKMETMEDQFLGNFAITGNKANIRCRDHEYPDGDRVRVFVNGTVFIIDLLLTGNFKSFDVPLEPGINKIEFVALNQGESGPNTAEFQVFDDNGVLVSSKKWNLLTGVTATILLIKE